jgi:hypothetical protein
LGGHRRISYGCSKKSHQVEPRLGCATENSGENSEERAAMSDPRYPESGAYHEAGHIVVAAAQGMHLSAHGVHVAPDGRGISYYSRRKKRESHGFDEAGKHTIISVFAGLIAQ